MAFLSGVTSLVTSSPTVLAVGAGVLAGAVTGTAVVASGVLSSPEPQQLALVACPASETVVARVTSGQQMLVTAKSGDGSWLQLYIGEPGLDSGWAPASALRISDPADNLPVAGCEVAVEPPGEATPTPTLDPTPTPEITAEITLPPGQTPTPTPVPTPTPRPTPTPTPLPPGVTPPPPTPTPTPAPTPTPTPLPPPPTIPPTPTPTPSPVPDTTPPTVSSLNITGAWTNGNGNYFIYNAGNPCGMGSVATISASVTDTGGSGLAGYTVTLRWKDPYGNQYNQQMTYSLSTFRYSSTITNQNAWPDGAYLEYWITASDNAGNTKETTHPPDNSHWLFKGSSCIL